MEFDLKYVTDINACDEVWELSYKGEVYRCLVGVDNDLESDGEVRMVHEWRDSSGAPLDKNVRPGVWLALKTEHAKISAEAEAEFERQEHARITEKLFEACEKEEGANLRTLREACLQDPLYSELFNRIELFEG